MIFASNEEEVMVGTIFAKYFFGKRITPYASHKELSYPWDTVILSGCCILIFGRIFSPDCSDVGTGHKSEHRPRNSARAKPGLSCIVSRSSTDFRALGGIQVLRHQRDGWVGWPNDDVWWQGGWLGVAKWWREQKIYIISIKNYLKSIYLFEDITDQFNSSVWISFFWRNELELVCSFFQ